MQPCFRCLVAIAVAASVLQDVRADIAKKHKLPHPHVDCGGHWAETCTVCPQGHGELWCHGDCTYVFSNCEYTTFWVRFKKMISNLIDFYFYLLGLWFRWSPLVLLFAIIMAVYASVYKSRVVAEYPDWIEVREVDFDEFEERDLGIFSVFKMPNTCLWAFFCTPVLAAKNYEVGKSMAYWPSCIFMFFMYTPLSCVAVVMHAIMSSKLLRNIKIRPSLGENLVLGCCCMCCAVGRESLEVDMAEYRSVTCPFNVEDTFEPTVVEEFIEKERACTERVCGTSFANRWFNSGEHKGYFHKTESAEDEEEQEKRRGCGS